MLKEILVISAAMVYFSSFFFVDILQIFLFSVAYIRVWLGFHEASQTSSFSFFSVLIFKAGIIWKKTFPTKRSPHIKTDEWLYVSAVAP